MWDVRSGTALPPLAGRSAAPPVPPKGWPPKPRQAGRSTTLPMTGLLPMPPPHSTASTPCCRPSPPSAAATRFLTRMRMCSAISQAGQAMCRRHRSIPTGRTVSVTRTRQPTRPPRAVAHVWWRRPAGCHCCKVKSFAPPESTGRGEARSTRYAPAQPGSSSIEARSSTAFMSMTFAGLSRRQSTPRDPEGSSILPTRARPRRAR